jgi:hypothetical protein
MNIIKGSNLGDADPDTELKSHNGGINFTWDADDGSAGGKVKLTSDFNKADGGVGGFPVKWGGRVWWKPLDILRIEFFNLEDEGVMGRGNAIAWGYQSNSAADNVVNQWNGWNSFSNAVLRSGHGFFGGVGGGANENVLFVSLAPIDMLTINFGWDLAKTGGNKKLDSTTEGFFKHTLAQVLVDLSGIGNIGLSFAADESYSGMTGWVYSLAAHTLALDFTLTMLDGMNIEIGAKIPVNGKMAGTVYNNPLGTERVNIPVEIGLGYTLNQWTGEALQVQARAGFLTPTKDYKAMNIALDVNPSYDIGIFRVYADMGFGIVKPTDSTFDISGTGNKRMAFFWHFTPYLKKGIGIGDLYFGINVWNGKGQGGYESTMIAWQGGGKEGGTGVLNWAVPVHFDISF